MQNLEFDWDKAANLKVRRDNQANKREEFDYDGLYRLTQTRLYATVGGGTASATDNHTYDTIGNLTNKGGASPSYTFAGYNYGARTGCTDTVIRPHAVYQVNAAGTVRRYCYDANGNLAAVSKTSGTGPLIYDASTWWVANLARRISQGGTAAYSDFWYGPNRERIQQTAKKSATVTETTLYVGGAYEKVTRGATTEHVHYIRGGGDVVAIHKKIAGGATETRYLHRDHLGSVVAATDATGAVLERYSFDPWGKRRDPATWVPPAPGTYSYDPAFNDRGFTGHEHIDHLGLVNMNGRVYDPEVGRFLSADPFVQFPESTQGYNRYSYVGNNPLSYADPSGFFSLKKVLKVLGFAMSFIIPTGINLWWEKMLWGFASGLMASGGDLKAGVLGGLGGLVFHGIGEWKALNDAARVLVHGLASGALAELGGSSFKSGFFGGSLGALGGMAGVKMFGAPAKGDIAGAIKRTLVAAVAGGIGSEAGGGKFKNGALTAAMAHLFNSETHAPEEKSSAAPAQENSGRKLTQGEVELVKSTYGDSVDTDRVRVFHRKYIAVQDDGTIMTPNGNLYAPESTYLDDYSMGSDRQKELFMHEIAHVLQFQEGVNVRLEGIKIFLKGGYAEANKSATYDASFYDDYLKLNIEQQATLWKMQYIYRRQMGYTR